MKTLLLLLAFFHLHVDDPANPPADAANPEVPADDQLDLDLDAHADDPDGADAGKTELETAKREAATAKADAERYQRELAEARAQRPAPRIDEETAREDTRLNAADTPELEKWQIRANRELRAGRTAANTALMQAEDVRDQTSFSQLSVTEPALHKRYAAKVEEALGQARSQGYNPKREVIYNQLIAKDMREGKFKKKAAPAAGDDPKKSAPRGKLPGVKSDMNGKSGMSDHEKRRARLENVQI